MHEIGTPGNNPFTITLPRMIGESWEDYAKRCQELANHVLSLMPKAEPSTFDFSDTSKYKRVGPTSWEAITPDYESTEEPTNERDTHFAGFAELLYTDLAKLFINQWSYRITGESEQADLVKYSIRDLIAKRAYDLVFHLLKNSDPLYLDMSDWSKPLDEDVHHNIAKLPDLTEWPKPE